MDQNKTVNVNIQLLNLLLVFPRNVINVINVNVGDNSVVCPRMLCVG